MLTRKQRFELRQAPSFFDRAHRIHTKYLILYYLQVKNDQVSQATVIVPKKKAARAVRRNQLKRQLRAVVAPFLRQTNKLQLVVYLKRSDFTSFSELVQDFARGWQKITT